MFHLALLALPSFGLAYLLGERIVAFTEAYL
jgi:hypothetical protein